MRKEEKAELRQLAKADYLNKLGRCTYDGYCETFEKWIELEENNLEDLLKRYIGNPDIGQNIKVKIICEKNKITIIKVVDRVSSKEGGINEK
jgi:hypothetical protein